jgi:hypothetical protein
MPVWKGAGLYFLPPSPPLFAPPDGSTAGPTPRLTAGRFLPPGTALWRFSVSRRTESPTHHHVTPLPHPRLLPSRRLGHDARRAVRLHRELLQADRELRPRLERPARGRPFRGPRGGEEVGDFVRDPRPLGLALIFSGAEAPVLGCGVRQLPGAGSPPEESRPMRTSMIPAPRRALVSEYPAAPCA